MNRCVSACPTMTAITTRTASPTTREAGVRRLEQTLGRVVRKVALKFAESEPTHVTVTPEVLVEMLGPEPALPEEARKNLPPGVATGLAWTEAGGDVLYIEATLLPNGKDLTDRKSVV